MLAFIAWYLIISLLGLLTFPLAYHFFPALSERGYSLSRALGLLLWAFIFWLLASLQIIRNNNAGIVFALLCVGGLSLWTLAKIGIEELAQASFTGHLEKGFKSLLAWGRSNLKSVLTVEVLFLLAFVFMALIRAANPESVGTEKPMEQAFINAILRSPTFPPHDPWLSGFAISYYYFGYVMTAMLAKLTATSGAEAFNLMLALLFGLNAIGAYGILFNLLAKKYSAEKTSQHAPALFAPLFLLFVSNLGGLFEALHRRGLFWTKTTDGTLQSAFWTWLNVKEWNNPPLEPFSWVPQRFWWWWQSSRVVQDFDLAGNFHEIIDEFPFFSYLLGDLHPHVLAMPFALLLIGAALNLFLGGWQANTRLHLRWDAFVLLSVITGGMAFLNTWDFPIYWALICAAFLLWRARLQGWDWKRAEEVGLFALALGALSVALYLPFYLGFSSQAGGIFPNLISPTRGTHLWVMFATLLIPIFVYFMTKTKKIDWKTGFGLGLGLPLLLLFFSLLLAAMIILRAPEFAGLFLATQNANSFSSVILAGLKLRLDYGFSLVTLIALLVFSFGSLARIPAREEEKPSADTFIALLILFGALLVLAPEFVFLLDQFNWRMNTIFKFYYQAWLLWSLAAAFGAVSVLRAARSFWKISFSVLLVLVLAAGLLYPLFSIPEKTNDFKPAGGLTLDSSDYLKRYTPDDAAAIDWLLAAPAGVVMEAVGGSYTEYGRMSTYSGQPGVLGWPGHESQWRGSYAPQGTREIDIERLYATPDWNEAQALIERYNIRYVVVGDLEQRTYQVSAAKFARNLPVVFSQGNLTIYGVP